ncbi:hypothetical protein V2W30_27905 [Streptomyces sp. Q6]|uniref:Uncharacterized protein n=1 Tax=Streptomyces citrinus TaxID=3118173 RepID=A0ACD5AHU4_9ACTN
MTHGYGQQGGPAGGFGAPPPAFQPAPPPPPPVVPGPEFVAADEYNGLVVDSEGAHFEQGPHAIDLPWSRLRTVHFQPLPSGLSVTAVTHDGPVFACQVRARRRSQVATWSAELGAVLQHYLQGR